MNPPKQDETHEMHFKEYLESNGEFQLYLQRWQCHSCGRTIVVNNRTRTHTVEIVGNNTITHYGGVGAKAKLAEIQKSPEKSKGGIYFLNPNEDKRPISVEEEAIRNQWSVWIEKIVDQKKK